VRWLLYASESHVAAFQGRAAHQESIRRTADRYNTLVMRRQYVSNGTFLSRRSRELGLDGSA
jgi:hypothetical protein